ncbi:PREDICTED: (3S,6E)-nerolidol synthase 1-like isoform X2 [Ipomoea nil]|uniref:(3S,6E)-nerolidol synthase 1-like isoform X2 n=1 Tax=Ipomoea nil TaxID=35883 RepID=UPI000901F15B|nr:PREDICTED: (3S,6E)-nerolidol synthase 1-like isoform X2 [Ipomoea nil]
MSFLPLNTLLRLNYAQPPPPPPPTISSHASFSKGADALHRRRCTPFHFRCQSMNSGKIGKDEPEVKYEEKMEEVRNFLYQIQEDDLQVLHVINAIQHLGIDHHFQDQIGSILQRQYNKFGILFRDNKELFETSILFRLLRQDGYHIPSDVFTKFINDKGKFKEELSKDIKGLMALHEASHLSIQGEDILDEAEKFSRNSLITNMACLDDRKAIIVQSTLQNPYHKSFSRLKAKTFIENMRFENEWEASLVNLATMDYGITQSLQQEEIFQVLQWWKGLGLMNELAKKQQLKWYIWTFALPDPSRSKERVEITKLISLVYLIDNIIDVYATFDQTIQFLDAICRWEISVAEGLPNYMKRCLVVLFDTTNDISNFIFNKYGWNSIDHLKKAWKSLCGAYITEAKWFATGNCPTADEYLKIGIITTGVPMALIASFLVLGHDASNGTTDIEEMITSVGAILRLLDDLDATQGEKQDGNDASYVEYYVKENHGVSLSDGKQRVINMVSEQWKLLNKQCLSPTPIPTSFRKACLNVARMVPMMYNYS